MPTCAALITPTVAVAPRAWDPVVIQASVLMVQAEVDPLRALMPNLERFDQALEQLFQQHPDQPVFDSLPGPGPALAPPFLAALGSDRDRYQDAAEVQCFSGIAPVTERSGKTPGCSGDGLAPNFCVKAFTSSDCEAVPLRRRCELWPSNGSAFYRCWKDRTPYDERIYLQALQRHGSPLMAALALWPPQEARA